MSKIHKGLAYAGVITAGLLVSQSFAGNNGNDKDVGNVRGKIDICHFAGHFSDVNGQADTRIVGQAGPGPRITVRRCGRLGGEILSVNRNSLEGHIRNHR